MSGLKEAMNAVREHPKHAGSWVALGEILLAEHQLDKATQSFQRALQLEPTNNAAQRGLAQILLAGNGGTTSSAPTRPAPTSPSSRSAPPTQASPAPRPVPSQTPPRSQTQPRTERTVAAPPRTPSPPAMRDSQISRPQRGVAAPMELRTPPPRPRKPSQTRMMMGFMFLGLVPLLCVCLLVLALAKLI